MAIQVVCPGCHKRFQVSDQFAGRKGPCPSCKAEIDIPSADEQVVVHAPETEGPTNTEGQPVLKPIVRQETKVSALVWTAILGGIVLVFCLALVMRFSITDKTQFPLAILVIGAIGLGPPVAAAGYSFLRDDELEGFAGGEFWLRASICGVIYAALWVLYAWGPGLIDLEGLETYQLAVFSMILTCIGAVAPLAIFDFEYLMGIVHYGLYLAICVLLCMLMGYYGFLLPLPPA